MCCTDVEGCRSRRFRGTASGMRKGMGRRGDLCQAEGGYRCVRGRGEKEVLSTGAGARGRRLWWVGNAPATFGNVGDSPCLGCISVRYML